MRVTWLCLLGGLLLVAGEASAGRACLERATGKLLEYQTHMASGTCERNWVTANPQYGYQAGDIEDRVVSEVEWAQLREEQIEAPRRAREVTNASQRQEKVRTLQTRLGLTTQEFEDLREVVR